MGTNYYALTGETIEVECDCGFTHVMPEKLHIGKNSYGWMFSLHAIPEKGLFELKDWEPILKRSKILDEYGTEISFEEMRKTILKKEKRALTKDQKKKIEEHASQYGYLLDKQSWLLHLGPRGNDGNYVICHGEFS